MVRILLFTTIVLVSSIAVSAQIRSAADRESANILRIDATLVDRHLKIESAAGFPHKSSLVSNRSMTFKAFVLCIPPAGKEAVCSSRVFVTDMRTGKTSVITGEPSEAEVMRPVDELKWLDNDRLSYERWMNPHFGHRYVVNIKARKQIGAWILSDAR